MSNQRAVIFANGLLPDETTARSLLHPDDLFIAADGGARHALRLGVKPAWLVGDLDSLDRDEVDELAAAGVGIRRYPPEKDETDLELALRAAIEYDCNPIIVTAALGGRMDQALANLYLLLLPELGGRDVRLDDGIVEAWWIRGEGRVAGAAGDLVSLLPLLGPAQGITTEGLRYPLGGETLYPHHSRGISNEMAGNAARILIEQGILLCVHERRR
jgi:thiamine pyrophosphokinase